MVEINASVMVDTVAGSTPRPRNSQTRGPAKIKASPPGARQTAEEDLDLFCLGLDQTSTPLILLTAEGTIRHVNPAAQRSLHANSTLRIRQGRLSTNRQEETKALAALIVELACAAPLKTPSRSMTLCDRAGCVIMILVGHRLDLPKVEALIILRVADLRTWPGLNPTWLKRVFGLTQAEASVATSLFAGHDLVVTAAARQCDVETVRTLLKRTMRKLGVSSQAQMRVVLHSALAATDL